VTNFQFFKYYSLKWLYILWLPKLIIFREDDRPPYLKDKLEAWGYYDPSENTIYISRRHDYFWVRAHEYGHWFNCRIWLLMDALWEIPWWAMSGRELFRKERS
jgi:hypothetical protein